MIEMNGKVWLHRISYEMELSYPLLERGYLTIGYSAWSSVEFLDAVRGPDGWAKNDEKFLEILGKTPRSRHYLWRFLVEMSPGDLVIVPSWGEFSVYRIVEAARSFNDRTIDPESFSNLQNWHGKAVSFEDGTLWWPEGDYTYDLGFFIEVEAVETKISRGDYADAPLTSLMKWRGSTKECSSHRENLEAALRAFREKRPINLHAQILDSSEKKVLELLQQQLNPDKLEKLIAWYFTRLGADQVYIPAKNERDKEGDGDIVATFEALRTIFYVQVKHFTGTMHEWAVQQVTSYSDHRSSLDDGGGYTHIPWVITTAEHFSDEALRLAAENGVKLFNGEDLARMILETGISTLDTVFS